MLKKVAQTWYRFELKILASACRRLEAIKDNQKKDSEARFGAAVMMTEILARKDFLEKALGVSK